MKSSTFLSATLMASTMLVGLAGAVSAGGTAPGTSILNSIDLSYTTGGDTINRANAASVTFVVDRKVDFIFESQVTNKTLAVQQGAEDGMLVFYLENEGNGTSGYDLDVALDGASTLSLTLDTTGTTPKGSYTIYVGSNDQLNDAADVIYDPSSDRNIGDLIADDFRYIKIVTNVADNAADGTQAVFNISAKALEPGNAENNPVTTTALTGQGLAGVDTILADADANGVEGDNSKFIIQAPQLSGIKTVAVISENLNGTFDCVNGASQGADLAKVPGGCLEYTLEVTNATGASVAADQLLIQDALPDNVTYVANDAGDFDSVSYDAGSNTVTANLASLAQDDTAAFTIRVTID